MIGNMFTYWNQVSRDFAESAAPESLREKLNTVAVLMGDEAFRRRVAKEIVEVSKPEQAIPEILERYRSVVADGIEFFLSQVGRDRLIELVISQLKLNPEADARERLLEVAKRFPTLHKLGQIIARNRKIDPEVKKWLVHLENGLYGTPLDGIMESVQCELERTNNRKHMDVAPIIVAEASVGVVVPFHWTPASGDRVQGVFKILKPGIRARLDEELVILAKMAAFFEENRHRYPFQDFRFLDIFQEVREMLVREIDLAAERRHLTEARRLYGDVEDIRIPRVYPFSTDAMTAMERLDGRKITDAALSREQRKHCASVLFEALVCRPLFSRNESSLFHGDPHAGNILAVDGPASDRPLIGLLDWSQAGRLTRHDRIKTAQLIQAVYKKDLSGIRRSVKALARGDSMDTPTRRRKFRNLVLSVMRSPEFAQRTLMKRTFKLMGRLAFEGFVFPAELMLFLKSFFTLEGVIYDLWPAFEMDTEIRKYVTSLMTREIPRRVGGFFLPLADRPENYASLISNSELQSFIVHRCAGAVNSVARSLAGVFIDGFRRTE